MDLQCPECGGKDIRTSQVRTLGEALKNLLGLCPVRCRDCDCRFTSSIWGLVSWRYARCPKCLRTDLSTWDLEYYNPPQSTLFLLMLGGKRMRCEYCRCNFVSFRKRKSRFVRRPKKAVKPTVVEVKAGETPDPSAPA